MWHLNSFLFLLFFFFTLSLSLSLFVNRACLSKHEQRLSLSQAFSSAPHPWLARHCQRFDSSPALSFVGHDGDSVSTLQSQNRAQCEASTKFIKRDYLHLGAWNLRCLRILLWDLGFIASHRDGKPRFRSSAPPPDGAERLGSQRRVSDGARRTRIRAAPRSLPAREILLIPPFHGSALRSVLEARCFSPPCNYREVWIKKNKTNKQTKKPKENIYSVFLSFSVSLVWSICSPYCKIKPWSSSGTS